MRMLLALLATFFILLSTPKALAATTSSIEVQGTGIRYSAKLKKKQFIYQDWILSRTIEVRPCNQPTIDNFFEEFERKRDADLKIPEKALEKSGLKLKANGKSSKVAPGGEFGRWLQAVPSQIHRMLVEAEFRCGKK